MLECVPLEVTMPVSRNLTHSALHWNTAHGRSLYKPCADAKPSPNREQIINFLFSSRLMEWARHQRSGPHPWNIARCTSLKLELSLQLKRKNLVSELLAFVHSLVTTFPTSTPLPPLSQWQSSPTQWPNNLYCRQHDHSSNIPCNSCTTLPTPLVTS